MPLPDIKKTRRFQELTTSLHSVSFHFILCLAISFSLLQASVAPADLSYFAMNHLSQLLVCSPFQNQTIVKTHSSKAGLG